MMTTDWSQTEYGRMLADQVRKSLEPKLRESAIMINIVPDKPDVKVAVELGLAVFMDKPIVVLVPEGRQANDHLRRLADVVIEGDPTSEEVMQKIQEYIQKFDTL